MGSEVLYINAGSSVERTEKVKLKAMRTLCSHRGQHLRHVANNPQPRLVRPENRTGPGLLAQMDSAVTVEAGSAVGTTEKTNKHMAVRT